MREARWQVLSDHALLDLEERTRCDQYRVFTIGYANNPDWTQQLFRGVQTGNQNSPVYAEIWAGFPQNPSNWKPSISGLTRRFSGILDTYDPDNMTDTEFHLRSIAAPLTTDRITSGIQNLTTTEFLRKIAAPYNINVVVDPSIQALTLAKVYAQEFMVGLKNLIKWDVLLKSSIFDDTDVWEDDGTLYYVHPWNVATVVPNLAKTLELQYGVNVRDFKPSHSPQFSRNVKVVVHSYVSKTRVSVATRVQSVVGGVNVAQVTKKSTAIPQWGTNGGTSITYNDNGTKSVSRWTSSGGSSQGSTQAISESGVENYDLYLPNLTPTECQALAIAIWRQISQHEYQGEFELAVTPDNLPYLNIEARINLQGYGMSLFNTEYWPRTMDETFEMTPDPGSGSAAGWTVKFHGVSHTLPPGGGI